MSNAIEQVIDEEARAVSRLVLDGQLGRDEGLAAILELAERSSVPQREGAVVGRRYGRRYDQVSRDAAEAYRDIIVDRILSPDKGWDFAKGVEGSLCGALRQLARKSLWVSANAGRPRASLREVLTGDETESFAPPAADQTADDNHSLIDEAIEAPTHLRPFAAIFALLEQEGIPEPVRPRRLRDRMWIRARLDGHDHTTVRSARAFRDLVTGTSSPDLDLIDDRLLAIWDSMTVPQIEAVLDMDPAFIGLIASYSYRDLICPSKGDLRRMRALGYAAAPKKSAQWNARVRDLIDAFVATDTDSVNPQDRKARTEPVPTHRRSMKDLTSESQAAVRAPGSPLGGSLDEVYESLCRIWRQASLRMMEGEEK